MTKPRLEPLADGSALLVIPADAQEYVRVSAIASMFGVSRSEVRRKLDELQTAYDIRTIQWSPSIRLVHLADFRRALFDSSNR